MSSTEYWLQIGVSAEFIAPKLQPARTGFGGWIIGEMEVVTQKYHQEKLPIMKRD